MQIQLQSRSRSRSRSIVSSNSGSQSVSLSNINIRSRGIQANQDQTNGLSSYLDQLEKCIQQITLVDIKQTPPQAVKTRSQKKENEFEVSKSIIESLEKVAGSKLFNKKW